KGAWTAWNPLGDPCEGHAHRSIPYPVSTVLIGRGISWSPWTLYCMKTSVAISSPATIVSRSGPAFPPPDQKCSLYVTDSDGTPRIPVSSWWWYRTHSSYQYTSFAG